MSRPTIQRQLQPLFEACCRELSGVEVTNLLPALLEHNDFVSLQNISSPNTLRGAWYRAQFGLIEDVGKTPLQALCAAFLRNRGYELI